MMEENGTYSSRTATAGGNIKDCHIQEGPIIGSSGATSKPVTLDFQLKKGMNTIR